MEFAVPYIEGTPSVEGRAFWTTLQRRSPELALEALKCYAKKPILEQQQAGLKVLAARKNGVLFLPQHEALCVRPLAERMSFTPATLQVDVVDGRVRVADAELKNCGGWEGLQPARSSDGFIKGTRVLFPADGPRL